jgi:hypothetical protein
VLETATDGAVGAGGCQRQRQRSVAAQDMGCPGTQSDNATPRVGIAMKSAHFRRRISAGNRTSCSGQTFLRLRQRRWLKLKSAGGVQLRGTLKEGISINNFHSDDTWQRKKINKIKKDKLFEPKIVAKSSALLARFELALLDSKSRVLTTGKTILVLNFGCIHENAQW